MDLNNNMSGSYSEPQRAEYEEMPNSNYRPAYSHEEPISVGNWFLTLFICAIPIVGLIMLLIWSFSGETNENKKNFAKAQLIWTVIGVILSVIISMAVTSLMVASGLFQKNTFPPITVPPIPLLAERKFTAPPVLSAPPNAACAACIQLPLTPPAKTPAMIPFVAGGNCPG